MPKTRAALFVNPAAASGLRRDAGANAILARHFELAVHETRSAAELFQKARLEAASGCPVIIAGGGDGTINGVINAIAGTPAVLGILPIGTANDLARQLGIPRDAEQAATRITTGTVRKIDLIDVGGNLFSTAGAMGMVTQCAAAANRIKASRGSTRLMARLLGMNIYATVTVPIIFFSRGITWNATLESIDAAGNIREIKTGTYGIFFTNQAGVGGNLTLPVDCRNDDGEMEICVIPAIGRFRLAGVVLALKRGRRVPASDMKTFRAVRATLRADRPFAVLGDGEIYGEGMHFDWCVRPGGLSVLA